MKKVLTIAILFIASITLSKGQVNAETEIKKLEQHEIDAIHKADTTALLKLWSKSYVVNNPYGEIVTVSQILGFIRAGKIDYSTVDRVIERITFTENIAIVMGKEIVTPQNVTANAGKSVTRRYTNIWIKSKSEWHLTARQATNFVIE